ncbi:transporter substrate-binding domain-containing protein [Pseudomonas sp. ANT_H14]|uniref:transporter substrate-binding domain-containing protein n=1 Tax=unclassified Pseudomonas TaxID=196821 RepID=UPI0011ED3D2D|nr:MULTISPECIES: transporter substrate-binding domain-containing protein [unclassified Pseudomonas]KAA0946958.1 transporter substrate-binding domain-containing protein [Pseudomonas sp. ANT_H4]KAA0953500.1 transporter substrate-binding domain-containing protein [Pseudomonas sp. ANT_H14]
MLSKQRVITLAATLSLLFVGTANAGAVLDKIQSSKTMTVATSAIWPPQGFINDKNEIDGFDIDVSKEIAKRLGVEVKFITPDWDVITAGKWNGRWDMSVGSMTATKSRARILDFPATYYYVPYVFAVHNKSTVTDRQALNGKKIGVEGGTTSEDCLNQALAIETSDIPPASCDIKAGELRTYAGSLAPLDDLRLGDGVRLDAILTQRSTLEAAIKKNYPLKAIDGVVFYEPLAIATDKGDPELTAKLAEVIGAMHTDGTLTKLSTKWYGVDYSTVK